ncbi:hypothetical protein ACQ856_11825 [Mycolicibacterium psychrotolerans]|uniref:hypothetical protein n=1 Tax=Mycolicibacterium psychrotolerans TaxID=216929 RepID=UPI003D66AAA0
MMYRQFANRGELFEALLRRATGRVVKRLINRVGPEPDGAEMLTEAYVIIATELVAEPLYKIFAQQAGTSGVAVLLTNAAPYIDYVECWSPSSPEMHCGKGFESETSPSSP